MNFMGGCHCGCIEIEFATDLEPSEIEVRACQCSFCRKHNSRTVTDPDGQVVVRTGDHTHVSFYEFGLRTATYLLCRRCGVYVAAITNEEPRRALVVVNCLRDHERFSRSALRAKYDTESRQQRILRRRSTWTPAAIIDVGR